MSRGLLVAALAGLSLLACSRPSGLFSEANARAHVGMLAGTIGSRAVGTPANARAREYIVDQLKLFGFEVRVQEADARRPELGTTARVANIIATLPGARREAIGADRALRLASRRARRDRRWPGRGGGAGGGAGGRGAGAPAVVADGAPDRRRRGRADGRGGADDRPRRHEPAVGVPAGRVDRIRRTGAAVRNRARATAGWSTRGRAARRTRAADRSRSRSTSGCRTTPTSPSSAGRTFPASTSRRSATATRITPRATRPNGCRRRRFATPARTSSRFSPRSTRPTSRSARRIAGTYFDVGGAVGLVYGTSLGRILPIAAIVFGVVAWVRVTATAVRMAGLLALAADGGLVGGRRARRVRVDDAGDVGAARRRARSITRGTRTRAACSCCCWSSAPCRPGPISRAGRWLPARAHGWRHPLVAWSVALPIWIALAMAGFFLAPSARVSLGAAAPRRRRAVLARATAERVGGPRRLAASCWRSRRRSGCATRRSCCGSWSPRWAACRSSRRCSCSRH